MTRSKVIEAYRKHINGLLDMHRLAEFYQEDKGLDIEIRLVFRRQPPTTLDVEARELPHAHAQIPPA